MREETYSHHQTPYRPKKSSNPYANRSGNYKIFGYVLHLTQLSLDKELAQTEARINSAFLGLLPVCLIAAMNCPGTSSQYVESDRTKPLTRGIRHEVLHICYKTVLIKSLNYRCDASSRGRTQDLDPSERYTSRTCTSWSCLKLLVAEEGMMWSHADGMTRPCVRLLHLEQILLWCTPFVQTTSLAFSTITCHV